MSCILAAQSCAYASLSNAALVKDACVRGFGAKPAPSRGCALKAKTPMQANSQRIGGICHAASAHGVIVQNVEDIMTQSNILTCSPDTPIDDALELLVEQHVTGLPVVDASNVVVGVVSDFDLLALEGVSAKEKARGFFPEAETDWDSFYEIQKLVAKNAGKCVGEVMTDNPITVLPTTSIADAANLLLRRKIRRLPVVNEQGVLVGIITRSNIIRAAWEARKVGQHL